MLATIDLSNPSATALAITSLTPIVLGGVTTYFKIFVDSPKDFRDRVNLRRKALLEQIAVLHTTLLNHSRRIDTDNDLRGDGHEHPDLVGNYNREIFRLFIIFHRIEVLRLTVKIAYGVLYASIAMGVLTGVSAAIFDDWRRYLLWVGVALIVIELLMMPVVYIASERMEHYEEAT